MLSYLIFIYVIALLIVQFYLAYKARLCFSYDLFTKPFAAPKNQFESLNDISLSDFDLEPLVASVVVPGRIPKSITYLQYPILDSLELLIHSSDTVKVHAESFRFHKSTKQWFKTEVTSDQREDYKLLSGQVLEPLFEILGKLPLRKSRYSVSFA